MDKVKDLIYNEPTPAPKRTVESVQPHRCAKHVEDLMVAIMNFEVQDQFSLVWQCMRSEKGQEPARHSPPAVEPKFSQIMGTFSCLHRVFSWM
ncbi:hypothetical protein BC939DRAFT_71691 [Gamsiella multidivaricata]|uniref:uncharacterized protein n=1 Tax=Gamsiella multidivaricata TaxID=101098 RepID=UPI00221E5B7E|nr:uncharacterized protein BC939DRAFT_71691 [Gamsiella multidivaricata]KAI7828242.1 hypothetical protein BC939DRAFT_71691 [Gamsiella multidivaricata]